MIHIDYGYKGVVYPFNPNGNKIYVGNIRILTQSIMGAALVYISPKICDDKDGYFMIDYFESNMIDKINYDPSSNQLLQIIAKKICDGAQSATTAQDEVNQETIPTPPTVPINDNSISIEELTAIIIPITNNDRKLSAKEKISFTVDPKTFNAHDFNGQISVVANVHVKSIGTYEVKYLTSNNVCEIGSGNALVEIENIGNGLKRLKRDYYVSTGNGLTNLVIKQLCSYK